MSDIQGVLRNVKPKALADVYRRAHERGATVSRTSKGHVRVWLDGRTYFGPGTASDYRALRNAISDIRRTTGLDLRESR